MFYTRFIKKLIRPIPEFKIDSGEVYPRLIGIALVVLVPISIGILLAIDKLLKLILNLG